MRDHWKPGDEIEAYGPYVRQSDDIRYRYGDGHTTTCPRCKRSGAGIVWAGWFTCDLCAGVAFIATGEFFTPKPKPAEPEVFDERSG